MATDHEYNEMAMLAMSLRRQNMTTPKIALYLGCQERYVRTLLARARKLWSLLTEASDSKTRIGENLAAFEEMERMALEKFAKVDPDSAVAVGYLNSAKASRVEIKKIQQESGLIIKVPDELTITGIPMEKAEARALTRGYLKTLGELSGKNDEP